MKNPIIMRQETVTPTMTPAKAPVFESGLWVVERRCERSIGVLSRLYDTYDPFPWLASEEVSVVELDSGGRVATSQWALSHVVELVCKIDISTSFYDLLFQFQ